MKSIIEWETWIEWNFKTHLEEKTLFGFSSQRTFHIILKWSETSSGNQREWKSLCKKKRNCKKRQNWVLNRNINYFSIFCLINFSIFCSCNSCYNSIQFSSVYDLRTTARITEIEFCLRVIVLLLGVSCRIFYCIFNYCWGVGALFRIVRISLLKVFQPSSTIEKTTTVNPQYIFWNSSDSFTRSLADFIMLA